MDVCVGIFGAKMIMYLLTEGRVCGRLWVSGVFFP
jgi:hypothetical protein